MVGVGPTNDIFAARAPVFEPWLLTIGASTTA